MKKSHLVFLGVAACFLLMGAGVVFLFPPNDPISEENASKIKKGMTEAEVIQVLGRSANATDPWYEYDGNFDKWITDNTLKAWWGKTSTAIFILFDGNGRVKEVRFARYPQPTFLDRLRSWLF